jgi:hypothetical protein
MAQRVHDAVRGWRAGAAFDDDVTLLALQAC